MTNTFYNPTGNPGNASEGLSALIRGEFAAIGEAFDAMPRITTTGLFDTVFNQVGNLTFTLPALSGTFATTANVATETTRATTAEGVLATAISTETARATASEATKLPLAGGTLTGPLIGTSGAFSGALSGFTIATGASASRSLADRAADVINLKNFGAVLNGVGSDSAAVQSARNVITDGGRIYVGPGTLNATAPTLPAASTAIWDVSAATPTGFNAFLSQLGTDIIHATNTGEWWYQLATSATSGAGTGPIMRIDRQMTHTGGAGWSMMTLNDATAAGANPGGQTTTMVINATVAGGGAHPYVGLFQQANRSAGSAQPIYGANFLVADNTNSVQNIAHIGVEWDILGNGHWLNQQAGVHDIVLKRSNSFPAGTAFRANFGVRVNNWTSTLAEGGFDYLFQAGATNVYTAAFGGTSTVQSGASFFDASAASFLGSPVALRLSANQLISMEITGQRSLTYNGTKLQYLVSGTEQFSVSDAGAGVLGGSLAIGGALTGVTNLTLAGAINGATTIDASSNITAGGKLGIGGGSLVGVLADIAGTATVGLRTSGATLTTGLRMGADQKLAFESTDGRALVWNQASGKLFYSVLGVNMFSIDASGNVRAAGTVTASVTP